MAALAAACSHRAPPPPPLPPAVSRPPVTEPTVAAAVPELQLQIEPTTVVTGEAALLTWEAKNAERVTISHDIGDVALTGRIKFFPEETTTYSVTATGPRGSIEETATVTVVEDSSGSLSAEAIDERPLEEQFLYFVKPVFFAFDSAELTDEARLTLQGNVRWLLQEKNLHLKFMIQGHCDQRGTEEYNLALGDKRAQVVKEYLVENGIDPSRISTLSQGEEQPLQEGEGESVWAANRRAQFVLMR